MTSSRGSIRGDGVRSLGSISTTGVGTIRRSDWTNLACNTGGAVVSVSASQDDLPHARRRAAHDAGDHFVAFDLAHDSVMAAPPRPGMVSGSDDVGESWMLVRDVRRWIETNRAELLASSDPARPLIWWAAPSPARLESLYRAARGQRAALRQARPTRISEVRLAPPVWGLYRIHQATGELSPR